MPSLNIHRNDTVKVLTGADRGKTGRVLRVFPDKGTVLVEHVRVVKKTVSSKTGQRTKGGIAEQESPINISNVALVCPNCGHSARGLQDGRRQQACGSARSAGRSCPRRSKKAATSHQPSAFSCLC